MQSHIRVDNILESKCPADNFLIFEQIEIEDYMILNKAKHVPRRSRGMSDSQHISIIEDNEVEVDIGGTGGSNAHRGVIAGLNVSLESNYM